MADRLREQFDEQLATWVAAACRDWSFPEPSAEFFANINSRLPVGLRSTIGFGLAREIVIPRGYTFTLKGLPPHKGPYMWFSRDNTERKPHPNWEYYVQVAEYVRLWQAFENREHMITFEDSLMDIGLYKDSRLLVCCEIKEKSSQAEKLIVRIKSYQAAVDLSAPDRGNDALRKAKYIVGLRPEYFYVVSIGRRYEFSVSFPEGKAFHLREDTVPFV
jgi:hypothetical protein